MAKFSRNDALSRFSFKGMMLSVAADTLPEGKSPFAANIRGYQYDQVTSRPPWAPYEAGPGGATGEVLALDPALGIWKVNGAPGAGYYYLGTLIAGGLANSGASLIPFRPNESPTPWEYIFDPNLQLKVLPNPTTPASSLVQKVGIAEPQTPADSGLLGFLDSIFGVGGGAASWTASGAAGALANGARVTDTVQSVHTGPLTVDYVSLQVSSTVQYQKGMQLTIAAQGAIVLDVFPQNLTAIGIAGIYYFTGATGHCVIVPHNVSAGPGDVGEPVGGPQLLSTLRRGALLNLGPEVVYVWSITEGPDATVCIETSTVNTITTGDTITMVPAIKVTGTGYAAAQAITSPDVTWTVQPVGGNDIGTIKAALGLNLFASANFSFQEEDYVHVSIGADAMANIVSLRIAFDVSDGLFDKDYYYYEFRPSDLQGANVNANTEQTMLGAVQILNQRAQADAIANQNMGAYNDVVFGVTGGQLNLGSNATLVWSELFIPISAFTRVGNDQTRTIGNAGEVAISVNATATTNFAVNSIMVVGGYQLDTQVATPYIWRYRARASQTGAYSNWSPVIRYGQAARRQEAAVLMPGAYPDPQADTFDIERMGGSLDDWTYAGSVLISGAANTEFIDNFGDDAIADNPTLPEDGYEPFPSIGPPVTTTATGANIVGFVALLTVATPGNATVQQFANLLPGNELQLGDQVYTFYSRPTLQSAGGGFATYLVYLVENAGVWTNAQATILEPAIANQILPFVWGPDNNGCLFAVGDKLRPGGVYNTNPQNPDAANEGVCFNELCPAIEPLINGALIQQTSVVASANRWWAGRAGQDVEGNLKYAWIEIPVGRGLAAPYGICSDGSNVYFVGKDGLYMHSGGPATSLTDEDLYPLFPHEGQVLAISQPANFDVIYASNVVRSPDYTHVERMRLAVINKFLYFTYTATDGSYQQLTMDLRTKGWVVDNFFGGNGSSALSIVAGTPAPTSEFGGNLIEQVFAGDAQGNLYTQGFNGVEDIECTICTREETGGDLRAMKMFGDLMLDYESQVTLDATPIALGNNLPASTLPASVNRSPGTPIDVDGEILAQTMGLQVNWQDTGFQATLFAWQVSWIPQPETTGKRFTDWDGDPSGRARWFQGFELEADTANQVKSIIVRDADQMLERQFIGPQGSNNKVQHNGQTRFPYTFITPFQAHLVRFEPQDAVLWRMFGVRWITQPTPDSGQVWSPQPTAYGLPGYHHVHHLLFAYSATGIVTLTLTTELGVVLTYTLPATGGRYTKVILMLAPIKNLVDLWQATCANTSLQVWEEDIEFFVKAWGDPGPYKKVPLIGASMQPEATI